MEDKIKEQLVRELASVRDSLRRCSAALQSRNQDLDDVARYVVSEFRRPLGAIVGYAELLEEDCATLSHEELCHCLEIIRQNGRRLGEMANVLLLLANSRRVFDNVWHAAYLAVLDEHALPQWAQEEGATQAYRFTCLPVSSAPLVVRAWSTTQDRLGCQASAKLGSSPEGREGKSGAPLQKATWALASDEWDALEAAVRASEFWSDVSSLDQLGWMQMVGVGGEQWIFEGWRGGQHRVRAVWNPDDEKAGAAYALGRSFLDLLPGWFALEMARLWASDSLPRMDQLRGEQMGLSSSV